MQTSPTKCAKRPSLKLAIGEPTGLVTATVGATLAALRVNPDTGLTRAEVDLRRKEHGYNEVDEKKRHPMLKLLAKFWGISAWMLELIMVLSAVLKNYADLAVVGALLVINAGLGFAQEHRAAGVVETLRRRLQVSARVRRNSSWHVVPARELVPGDIVRVRSGDIVPADLKLLTGALSLDQSALTGESKESDKTTGAVRIVAESCGLTPADIDVLESRIAPMATKGYRTLAVAWHGVGHTPPVGHRVVV